MRVMAAEALIFFQIIFGLTLVDNVHPFTISPESSSSVFGKVGTVENAFQNHKQSSYSRLALSSSSNDPIKKRSLSAAEQERREEEKRRRERSSEVVIGKTSAVEGATDFALDVENTEQQWLQQASSTERQVYQLTEQGMQKLKMLQLEEADQYFDGVFEIKPDAYLWQAGIAKFYLGDIEGAADIFTKSARIFELRFGEPASEERIWRHACVLTLWREMSKKDRKEVEEKMGSIDMILPTIPNNEDTPELLRSERRKAIRISRDLFEASVGKDFPNTILSRAKLRSIGGSIEKKPKLDRKLWKLNSWFYLGLHYDAIGEKEESKKCMKMAMRLSSGGFGSDIIHTLPMLHMTRRDWFDDEEIDFETPGEKSEVSDSLSEARPRGVLESISGVPADPVLAESIQSSLNKMRLVDLQEALKVRGLQTTGSKEKLQDRLFQSLMNDAGLMA